MEVRLENLCAGYGPVEVLHDISFAIKEGERVAILGMNGSGKTTLLRAMAGLLPYRGHVFLAEEGRPEKELKSMKRREISSLIAMMMQVSTTYFAYTVRETVMLGRYARQQGVLQGTSARDKEMVDLALKQTGLLPLADRPVNALSGGQLQRVFLARTLAQETPLILLDEPTNHLDLKIQTEIMQYLNEWAQEPGHTLVGVYHDLNLGLTMADRLIVLKNGQILADGPGADVIRGGFLEEAYEMNVPAYMRKQYALWEKYDTIL